MLEKAEEKGYTSDLFEVGAADMYRLVGDLVKGLQNPTAKALLAFILVLSGIVAISIDYKQIDAALALATFTSVSSLLFVILNSLTYTKEMENRTIELLLVAPINIRDLVISRALRGILPAVVVGALYEIFFSIPTTIYLTIPYFLLAGVSLVQLVSILSTSSLLSIIVSCIVFYLIMGFYVATMFTNSVFLPCLFMLLVAAVGWFAIWYKLSRMRESR